MAPSYLWGILRAFALYYSDHHHFLIYRDVTAQAGGSLKKPLQKYKQKLRLYMAGPFCNLFCYLSA